MRSIKYARVIDYGYNNDHKWKNIMEYDNKKTTIYVEIYG